MKKLRIISGVILPVINWLLWPAVMGIVAQAQPLQDLALIQRVYDPDGRYFPDPIVVQSGVPVRLNITTIQREHQNRVSIDPFFITSEPVVPGKVRAAVFTPEPPGEYTILNLGHGFTGTLFVMETAEEVAQKRREQGFQEFSLLYGTESLYPQEIFVQRNVPLKLYNIGLREDHTVSFEPFLETAKTITANDVTIVEFVPNRLGDFTIHDQTYDITARLVVVPEPGACDFNNDNECNQSDLDLIYGAGNLANGVPVSPATANFDLNADEIIDTVDLDEWLSEAATENGFASSYLKGDVTLDGTVDAADLNELALNWRASGAVWSTGDFTGEGIIDAKDLNHLAINWRQSIPMATQTVPEPSSFVLLATILLVGFARCRTSFERVQPIGVCCL